MIQGWEPVLQMLQPPSLQSIARTQLGVHRSYLLSIVLSDQFPLIFWSRLGRITLRGLESTAGGRNGGLICEVLQIVSSSPPHVIQSMVA